MFPKEKLWQAQSLSRNAALIFQSCGVGYYQD
jgi:hypothetical protein